MTDNIQSISSDLYDSSDSSSLSNSSSLSDTYSSSSSSDSIKLKNQISEKSKGIALDNQTNNAITDLAKTTIANDVKSITNVAVLNNQVLKKVPYQYNLRDVYINYNLKKRRFFCGNGEINKCARHKPVAVNWTIISHKETRFFEFTSIEHNDVSINYKTYNSHNIKINDKFYTVDDVYIVHKERKPLYKLLKLIKKHNLLEKYNSISSKPDPVYNPNSEQLQIILTPLQAKLIMDCKE